MKLDTPEGSVKITDAELIFTPFEGAETHVALDPMPEYSYTRGMDGVGALDIGPHVIVLLNEQAESVIVELRRPRKHGPPSK